MSRHTTKRKKAVRAFLLMLFSHTQVCVVLVCQSEKAICCLKKNQVAPRPCEHPPSVRGGKMSKRLGGIKGCKCCFSRSTYWLPTRKIRKSCVHGGQSRSWSAEGKGKRKREQNEKSFSPLGTGGYMLKRALIEMEAFRFFFRKRNRKVWQPPPTPLVRRKYTKNKIPIRVAKILDGHKGIT